MTLTESFTDLMVQDSEGIWSECWMCREELKVNWMTRMKNRNNMRMVSC